MGKPGGPRDVSREYDLESLRRATHRLSRHITDHLNGEFAAIDDVAALLRTLCAKGAGDKLIMRVVRSYGIEPAQMSYARPVEGLPGTVLELGAVPQLRAHAPSHVTLSLLEWLDTPALIAAERIDAPLPATHKRHTWQQLINDLANVRGSHATQTIAAWLDVASLGGVHDISLADYIIESAAVVVEDTLRYTLSKLGHPEDAPEMRQLPVRPVGVDWIRIGSDGSQLSVEADSFTSSWDAPDGDHHILSFAAAGKRFGTTARLKGGRVSAYGFWGD